MTSSDESEEDTEDIDVELKIIATMVTRIATEKKSMLDTIFEITGEDFAVIKFTLIASQQTASRSSPTTPKESSKRKEATSRGDTTPEEPQ